MQKNEIGRVKFYNHSKGFGFIEREVGCDIFIQLNSECGSKTVPLAEGQQVTFNLIGTSRNPQAENIMIIDLDISIT